MSTGENKTNNCYYSLMYIHSHYNLCW